MDVMVSPEIRSQLTNQLTRSGASYTVNIDNVQVSGAGLQSAGEQGTFWHGVHFVRGGLSIDIRCRYSVASYFIK